MIISAGCAGSFSSFWRSDRIARPFTRLPLLSSRKTMVWCDDPKSASYNRLSRLPGSPFIVQFGTIGLAGAPGGLPGHKGKRSFAGHGAAVGSDA